MSAQMWWKPGSDKPVKKNSKNKEPKTSKSHDSLGGGRKLRVEKGGITQLSNVTRNMRFMQRKQQDSTTGLYSSSTTHKSEADSDDRISATSSATFHMDVDGENKTDFGNDEPNPKSDRNRAASKQSTFVNPIPSLETTAVESRSSIYFPQNATQVDMFGHCASIIIGRRSFGGFNKHVAENWYLSSLSAKAIEKKDRSDSQSEMISDEELLKRYRNVVKDHDDHDKKSLVSKKSQTISNKKKKRNLDEFLI